MRKNLKITSLIVILLLICTVGIVNVSAQEAMKITRKTYINTGVGSRREAKFYTNKGYAYCITPHRTGPGEGTTLNYIGSNKGGGVAYLLNKTGTSDMDYLVYQLAIWKYDSNYLPNTYVQNSGNNVVQRANALANDAKNHSNWTTAPTLKFSVSTAKLSESSDRKSYKSGAIKAVAANNTTNVSLSLSGAPSGSKIVDGNGNTVNSVKSNQAFYVVVPASSLTKTVSFTINASTKGKTSYVERYSTGNSALQDLVILVKKEETVKASAKITVTPVIRKCTKAGNDYYGKDGKIVSYEEYVIQCEKPTCKKVGDKYFGPKGTVVTYEEYVIQCEKPACKKVGDKYLGPKGTVVTYEEYVIQCEKPTCKKVGNKYFGPKGTVVTYEEYVIQCEKPICKKVGDKYLGPNGTIITYEEYIIQCDKPMCKKVGNDYYGKDGKKVSYDEYVIQCEKPTCKKVGDKYFGTTGSEVSYEEYVIQCEKPTCKKVGDKYYGTTGSEVSYDEYVIQCEKPTCKKVGDKYYGTTGSEVSYDEYVIQCEKPTCKKVDDKYYGPTGSEVSYEEYVIQCEKPTCKEVDDKYYGPTGSEVSYEEYVIQCEKPKCEFKNNQYFGKDGNIVTQEQYENECIHVCEIYDNHYYGKWGDVVSPADYKVQCEAQFVPVPDTANVSPINLLLIVLGSSILGGTIGVITHFASNKAY